MEHALFDHGVGGQRNGLGCAETYEIFVMQDHFLFGTEEFDKVYQIISGPMKKSSHVIDLSDKTPKLAPVYPKPDALSNEPSLSNSIPSFISKTGAHVFKT